MIDINFYAESHFDELKCLLKDLCSIPAPSHFENKRAEFCKKWLEDNGAEGVYIDKAQNVVFPINCNNSDEITVIEAHTDTVFPDTVPMPYIEKDGKIFSPGVGDDTESVCALLIVAKYFIENKIVPKNGIMIVFNSCEEGLGNLKGTKQIFSDYQGRIKQMVSFDANINHIFSGCVGSTRYKVTVKTEGGHSFGNFGNKNAIYELSKIINKIYQIDEPKEEGYKTTYNVGIVSGGTSVNTIAQEAQMLCEYRSNNAAHLKIMKDYFERFFEEAKENGTEIFVEVVGERPCGEVDEKLQNDFANKCADLVEKAVGERPTFLSASTDCNIPLSLGIPSVCVGTYIGDNEHTREEWIKTDSIVPGLKVALSVALGLI